MAMGLTMGLSGRRRQACAAVADADGVQAVCPQERATRTRGAGFNWTGLPSEAIDATLGRLRATRADVAQYVFADAGGTDLPVPAWERVGLHRAYAATAYLTSSFTDAAIVVCDRTEPGFTVWTGRGAEIAPVEWPRRGPDIADLYWQCASVLGLGGDAPTQRLEALARLSPGARDPRIEQLWSDVEPAGSDWRGTVETMARGRDVAGLAQLAASLQARLIDLLLVELRRVQAHTGLSTLCVGGGLFYHSSVNTAIRMSGIFARVFVPVDPGESGLAVGAASLVHQTPPRPASPFLGPQYSRDEIKATLDNCKLVYSWESESDAAAIAAEALAKGRLVGWFDGGMEWGPRALGARCILANPFTPYLLENLNRFLKHRDPWRGYALSGLSSAVSEHFEGPAAADFMECDYRPRDPERFRHALPTPSTAIRVHTVGADAPPRFQRLLNAFGATSGLPFLVNTSFNGFREPIVCSPRDAIRVFYGSGVDVLVLDQFVLRK